ncbi:hypothetical protein FB446DRAFT_744193, partial [Lentinula raphanica]
MPMDEEQGLHVVIIGAGIGGLASALALAKHGIHRIDVYEVASNLGFVGAGIQLAPNMVRILQRLGCWEPIAKEATELKIASIRREYSDGSYHRLSNRLVESSDDKELSRVDFAHIEERYGTPHMVGHRASLVGELYNACKEEKAISFHFNSSCTIKSWEPRPVYTVTPLNGAPYDGHADVVLAADGIKSSVRSRILKELGVDAEVTDSGQSAYRIMLSRSQMAHDPEMLELPISSKTIYNISTAHPDVHFAAAPSATYTTRGSKEDMLDSFKDFCPVVKRMLDLVPDGEVCEWKLRVHSPLPTWVRGCVALVGDACHPTLPHLGNSLIPILKGL